MVVGEGAILNTVHFHVDLSPILGDGPEFQRGARVHRTLDLLEEKRNLMLNRHSRMVQARQLAQTRQDLQQAR